MNHPVFDKIRGSGALSLTARIAPHIDELNELVLTRLITWRQVAQTLGVNYQTLQSARRRVGRMREKWEKAGIRPAPAARTRSGYTTPYPTQDKKRLSDFSGSNNPPETPLSRFPTLPDYED